MNKGMLKGVAQELKSKGRYGDTELIHVNKDEKELLKALGGAGTINPDTGLEEYFRIPGVPNPLKKAEKVAKNVAGAAGDVVGAGSEALAKVEDVARNVVDPVVKLGENLEDGIRETVDEVDKLIQDPYVQLAVSIFAPQTAPFLDAYATLDSGETLSPSQIAALAASGYELDSGTKLPSEVKKGLDVGTKLAEGADPIKTLVSAYGEDFLESSGIKAAGETGLQNAIGLDAYNLIKDNMDVARVGYDVLVEGKDPLESISNRYGDEIVGALGSDNPSVNALGYAGLATAVQLDKGRDASDALLVGAKEYYDRGGQAPKLSDLGALAGIDTSKIKIDTPDFFKDFSTTLGFEAPDVDFAFDFASANVGKLGDWFKSNVPNINLEGVDWGQIKQFDVNVPDLIDVPDFQFADINFEGYKPQDLGYDFDRFSFEGFEGMKDLGIDVKSLDLGEFNIPQVGLALALAEEKVPGQQVTPEGEEVASLENELLAPVEGKPFSRKVLESTFA